MTNWQATVGKTVAGLGYELVECERTPGGLLRAYIDRVPGQVYSTGESEFVTVEDCEKVTRQLQYVLEVEGCDYSRLEVSSPGLDRPLKTPGDYARFVGERVVVNLKMPFRGRKKYEGVLAAGEEPLGDAQWALLLDDEAAPRASQGKRPARKSTGTKVAPETASGAALPDGQPGGAIREADGDAGPQVLGFRLDEVREARLVPVVNFKGRATRPAGTSGATAPQEQGGHEE